MSPSADPNEPFDALVETSAAAGETVAVATVLTGQRTGARLAVWSAGHTFGDLGWPRLNQRVALYAEQLARIVEYVDQIAQVEAWLAGAEDETVAPARRGPPRADLPGDTLGITEFLRNTPAALDRFLVVPQVK